MSAAARLLDRLTGVKQTAPGRWIAKCPAHEDRSPSLSIRVKQRWLDACCLISAAAEVKLTHSGDARFEIHRPVRQTAFAAQLAARSRRIFRA